MKVAITTQKELQDPHLELDINLETGTLTAALTYTCAKCGGYGCHHGGHCDSQTKLTPEEVLATLGPEAKPLLAKLFGNILGEQLIEPVEAMKSWLVFPEIPDRTGDWITVLELTIEHSDGQVVLDNILMTSGIALVRATTKGAEHLKLAGFQVNPNETKRAIGR